MYPDILYIFFPRFESVKQESDKIFVKIFEFKFTKIKSKFDAFPS